ncbi:MAG: SUMF1/EgtB/PvdO family nonheme iron enzyme [Candidatus Competibacteraceae bacterium]|nr:SUMF1/EgtB/PvdO family nonheme iron enzyme [Candidatus Competibacteraceae bacterium]
MMDLSGEIIRQLCRRLGEDWPNLARYFDISRERCKGFTPGREYDGIVAWLKERERLGELSKAFAAIDRDDLIPLLEAAPSSVLQTVTPTWPDSPFPGLRRFNPEDEPIFCGRHREIKGLLRKLADPNHRFIAVLGASGSGKSSLVAAGLIPQLQANAIAGGQDWPCLEFTPGGVKGDPYPVLAARLEPLLKYHGLRVSEITEILEAEQGYGLIELAEKALSNRPAQAELLLFVDQFEELFTLTLDTLRQPLIRLLTTTVRSSRVRVVVAMRADFLYRCLDYVGLDRLLSANSYFLGPPGPGALYEMMTGPAAKAGLEFEEGLVERILTDTGTGSGALALLAFALHQLYTSRTENGQLMHKAYECFGGVQHAIGQQAECTFQKLGHTAQAELERVFRELVQVDERGIATRQRASLPTIAISAAASELIDCFVDARLLVREPGEDGLPVVEVAHEALFRNWPRLQQWIQNTADDHRLRRHITQLAAYWHEHDRKPEHRWPDERIVEVIAMREHLKLEEKDFSERERDFLGPLDREQMFTTLNDPATTHEQRAIIGVRLALLGDSRDGVGLRADGVPDIVWCRVPPGTVTLEEDAGTFTIKEAFSIAKYPITYRQYRAFLEAEDGYHNSQWWQGLLVEQPPEKPGRQLNRRDNHPAENVAWLEAVPFCRWLSVKLGYEVRLPTEWEWQQAATGGDPQNKYPWGPKWDGNRANTYESELSRSMAVGMYPQGESPVGALDMSGNVWEFCLNAYDPPGNVALAGDARRVVRGGSWDVNPAYARAACRYHSAPVGRSSVIGFRLVCASPI